MIRDLLKNFSANCDYHFFFIFVNCDFINIFLVICERDIIFLVKIIKLFGMEYFWYKFWCLMCMNVCKNGKYIVKLLCVFDPINMFTPNGGALSTQRRHY